MRNLLALLTLPVGLALAASAAPVWSAVKQTPAAGACKSALPAFDGLIRTRPLAVQNEGTSPAFVSCAQQGDLAERPTRISIALINQNASVATVTCTLVVGVFEPAYTTRSTAVPAGATSELLSFIPPVPGVPFPSTNHAFSCSLPPGTGISRLSFIHD